MNRTVTACLFVGMALIASTHAAVPNQSKDKLQASATEIAIGTVTGIYTEETKDELWHKTAGVVEFQVTKLEKGNKIEAGDLVYARFSRQAWIGQGNPPPFDSGHHLPKKGDDVRVYLKRNHGGFDALFPNGFEITPKTADPKSKP